MPIKTLSRTLNPSHSLPSLVPASPRCVVIGCPPQAVLGPLAVQCGLRVVEEQEIRSLSCCELCCKLTTAVRDLPTKTQNPCTTSLLQPPEIWSSSYGCLSREPNIFVPLIRHSAANSPSNCLLRCAPPPSPIIFSPAAPRDSPAASPPTSALLPPQQHCAGVQ